MTIYNPRDQQAVPQPSISVEEIPTLSEIYKQDYPPVYYDIDDETPYKGQESLNKRIRISKAGDITNLRVDAVVNPVQSDLSKPPVGLCDQMFKKGGPMLKQACLGHAFCTVGEAFITEGFELPAKYVIHTAGPAPKSRLKHQERLDYLQQSYLSCFSLVKEQQFTSVAVPCLGTGRGGVTLQDGVKIAVTTIREWLETTYYDKLKHIVFCLFDTNQYKAVMKEMFQCFPRGTDVAGTDLEQLHEVPDTILDPPAWIHRTHIFCLKYVAKARSKISYHFHGLVNHCHTKLCPMDSRVERYSNCAVLSLTPERVYRCILLHNRAMNLIEVQIVKFSHDSSEISEDTKMRLTSTILDYLDTYLVNVTPFEKYLRCKKSTWQSRHGLWACKRLQLTVAMEIPCDHGNNMVDTHMIRPKDLLNKWPAFGIMETDRLGHLLGAVGDNPNPRLCKEPTEHSDSHSEENSHHFSTLSDMPNSNCFSEYTARKTESRSENNSITTELKACQNTTHLTGRGWMNATRPGGSNDRQQDPIENVVDFDNNFVSFTYSIETDIVRPKEYNIPGQHSISKSSETIEVLQNRHRNPAVQNISSTGPKPAKESTKACHDSNPAAQNTNCISLQTNTFIGKNNYDTGNNLQNTLEEDTSDFIEHPSNELKANLPTGGRLQLSNENTLQTSTVCFPNGKLSSKNGVVTNKHPSDKELLEIAEVLGLKHEELGIRLGLPQCTIERCRGENMNNLKMQGFHLLRTWFRKHKEASLDKLLCEMEECDIDTYDIKLNLGRL